MAKKAGEKPSRGERREKKRRTEGKEKGRSTSFIKDDRLRYKNVPSENKPASEKRVISDTNKNKVKYVVSPRVSPKASPKTPPKKPPKTPPKTPPKKPPKTTPKRYDPLKNNPEARRRKAQWDKWWAQWTKPRRPKS